MCTCRMEAVRWWHSLRSRLRRCGLLTRRGRRREQVSSLQPGRCRVRRHLEEEVRRRKEGSVSALQ